MILVTRNTCSLIKDHVKEYMFFATRTLCFWRDWNVISYHERDVEKVRLSVQHRMIAIIGFLYDVFHYLACGEVPDVGFVISMKFHPKDTSHGSDYHSWIQGLVIPCVLD